MKLQLIYILFLFSYLGLRAQSTSLVTAEKPKLLTSLYYDSLETSSGIYKGAEHVYYSYRIEGNPYFFSENMTNCQITYGDFVYDSIQGYYDVCKQLLIIKHEKLYSDIVLESRKISQFKIHGHVFEKLYLDSIPGMFDGFYDKIVDDKLKFYVWRGKEIAEVIENKSVRRWFVSSDRYYILKDGIYHRVRGKGSVLKILAEHKKKLKAYIRDEKISFSASPEDGIKKVVEYYNKL